MRINPSSTLSLSDVGDILFWIIFDCVICFHSNFIFFDAGVIFRLTSIFKQIEVMLISCRWFLHRIKSIDFEMWKCWIEH